MSAKWTRHSTISPGASAMNSRRSSNSSATSARRWGVGAPIGRRMADVARGEIASGARSAVRDSCLALREKHGRTPDSGRITAVDVLGPTPPPPAAPEAHHQPAENDPGPPEDSRPFPRAQHVFAGVARMFPGRSRLFPGAARPLDRLLRSWAGVARPWGGRPRTFPRSQRTRNPRKHLLQTAQRTGAALIRTQTAPIRSETGEIRPQTGQIRSKIASIRREAGVIHPQTGVSRTNPGAIRPKAGGIRTGNPRKNCADRRFRGCEGG